MVGLFMLLTILGGVIAQGFISERLIVFSDAVATANNTLLTTPTTPTRYSKAKVTSTFPEPTAASSPDGSSIRPSLV
jgi:hypothetical protein